MKAREVEVGKTIMNWSSFTNTMLVSESITTKALSFIKLMLENRMAKIKCIKTFPSQKIIACVPLKKTPYLSRQMPTWCMILSSSVADAVRRRTDGWSEEGAWTVSLPDRQAGKVNYCNNLAPE